MSSRSGQPGINASEYGAFTFYAPLLQEQKKIAYFMGIVNERIETQKKIIEGKKRLQKTIANLTIGIKCSSNLYAKTFFAKVYKKAKEGGTPNTKESENYLNGTIPFLQIDDLCTKYITKTKRFITEKGLSNSSAWLIPEGNIILSNGASVGQSAINKINLSTKQGILGIIPRLESISTEWVYYLLNTTYFKKELRRITTTGTFDAAYIKDINTIKLYVPSLDEQIVLSQRIMAISNSIENEEQVLNKLNKIKKFLLSQLFI